MHPRAMCLTTIVLSVLEALFAPGSSAQQALPAETVPPPRAESSPSPDLTIEIVESAPIETKIDEPDIRNAADVWVEMVRGAASSLDIAQMYLSNEAEGGLLEPVIVEVLAAHERGVTVRLLAEKSFYETYPETIDRLRGAGIEVRLLDLRPLTGGVLHAKYFIVDGREFFLGSQNFDWRSLEHIHEIGVRVVSTDLAADLGRIFAADWARAGGDTVPAVAPLATASPAGAPEASRVHLVASPPELDPPGIGAAEDELLRLIGSAKREVLVQVLTYSPANREGEYYAAIDTALRAAAARGVTVRMILSDWEKARPAIDYLKSLSLVPNVQVKLSTVPPWSGGFIPYARVEHCKYMVVDGEILWVGTSNWSRDYFHESRNVEIVIPDTRLAEEMWKVFYDGWNGPYTYHLRVDIDYPPPRRQ